MSGGRLFCTRSALIRETASVGVIAWAGATPMASVRATHARNRRGMKTARYASTDRLPTGRRS